MLFAMYLALAESRGVSWAALEGTIQNDILKEYIAQKEYIFPPRPSMRLVVDVFRFATAHVPKWNTISVSGYHIREAGATAEQELAMTLRDGIEYVEWGVRAGLEVDAFHRRVVFRQPQLPAWLAWLELRNVRVGTARLDVNMQRGRYGASLEIVRKDGDVEIVETR